MLMLADGMKMQSFYQTKDFNEASLLLAYKLPLISVKRGGPCFFAFGDYQKALQLSEAFWRGDLIGNIREFVDAQRRIKDLIHRDAVGSGKRGHLSALSSNLVKQAE